VRDPIGEGRRDDAIRAAPRPAILIAAAEARADFVQDVGSPLQTGNAPYGVAAGDFNGDGRPDVATANGDEGSVSIFLRGAAGGFSQELSSPVMNILGANDIAVGRIDDDAKLDLAVSGYVNGGAGVHILTRADDNKASSKRAPRSRSPARRRSPSPI
jgi:hypothetical protein